MDNRKRTALCILTAAAFISLTACGGGNTSTSYSAQTAPAYQYRSDEVYANVEAAYSESDETAENSEKYAEIRENGFTIAEQQPLSTFSADVDTASYTNIRRMINSGHSIPKDAVRIEEIINYFDYDYAAPRGNLPFEVTTELSSCPWNEQSQLLLIGVQAKKDYEQGQHIPKNLVFLIDVSGSMNEADKLPLVQKAFTMLTDELDSSDRISVVTYAGSDAVLLSGESGENRKKINKVIGSLSAGGGTAGAAGIKTAYEIAEENFIEGGNNRIILATDGDLNIGASSPEELKELVEGERDKGIYFSVLGVGTGNYNDAALEAIADNGNGNYSYIDCVDEAKKVLVDEMDSTLNTVAKDVKFQVEFDTANVEAYRLIGYENRMLDEKDFEDDKKDAGDVGAGHTVTVLYEIIPAVTPEAPADNDGNNGQVQLSDDNDAPVPSDGFATINIRCKEPDADQSKLYTFTVNKSQYTDETPMNLNFAACCAEFGMILRDSEYKGTASYAQLKDLLGRYDYSQDEYKAQFAKLVDKVS